MRLVRRWLRGTASAALLLTLAATTTVWHVADDDRACNRFATANGSPDRFDIERQQPLPQHCFLCHWNRWVRSVPASRSEVLAHSLDARPLFEGQISAAVCARCGLIPGRSPPA